MGQGAASNVPVVVTADQYAGESIVLERSDVVYSMAADGTGSVLRTVVVRVQSEAAVKELGIIGLAFAGATQRVEFQYARVRRPDGTVVETPVGDAQEVPAEVTRQAPFYSDLKQKQLPIRSLRVGDTLEWQAKVVRTKAETPGEFWGQESFTEDAVVLEQSVELRVPKDKTVKVWSSTLKPVESVAGEERVYRWTNSQTKPTTGKEAEAEAEAKKKKVFTPEQEVDEKEGKLPTIAWTTFPSWEAVGAWYRGLEGDRMVASAEVKAKVAEVTAGKTTEEEKVRAVYGYVGTQVRYIGVAFGVGRYQPHRAEEVLENQYGDCKDKHTLLAAMLGVLGVKSDAVLVGAGIRFNPDVPSPASFNHLITLATVGGQPVWLDSTAEVAPYRMLVATTRDRKVLAVPDTGVARVEKTPAELPFKSFQTMDAVGSLDKDGVADSKITMTFRGDTELVLRQVLRQVAPAQYELLMQNLSQRIGFSGTTSHAEFSKAENTTEPLTVHYDYHRVKPGDDWDNLRILPQLLPIPFPIVDEKEPPVRSIELGVTHVDTSTAALKLPDGWGAELPEALHAHSQYANWDETYRFDKGTLYAERRMEVLVETVPQSDWKTYKKWADEVQKGSEKYVQLTRPMCAACGVVGKTPSSAKTEGGPATEITGGKASAETLVQSAYDAIRRNDVDTAIPMLDMAKGLNEKQRRLWLTYGYAAYRRGKWADAVADYEKELALYPETYGLYVDLANANMFQHKIPEAIAVARRWVAIEPSNPKATVLLMNFLSQQEDYAGAVKAGEAGIAGLPEERRNDGALQFALGSAQVNAGMKEKGVATLTALLKTTEDTGLLNSAAYGLSLTGEQLPLAEASTRKALDKMGDESKGWTLDENLATLRSKSVLIAATWDTLGWILFHEGKNADAEKYVQAAWMGRQDIEVGEHLGDLLAARGDKAGAAKMYKLALETIPARVPGAEQVKPTAQQTRALGKLNDVSAGGRVDAKSLQDMRKIPLSAAGGRSGTAEYKLLLNVNGVERAERTGEKEISGGDAMVKKAPLQGYVPEGSDAQVVRAVILNCHSDVCELVMEP